MNELALQQSDLSPIALICYNRPQHTRQVIDALAAPKDKIFVFCDGPKNAADAELCHKVRSLFDGWPNVITRPRNVGLATSVVSAVEYVLARWETVIVLEDDCVPGPYFYQYMNDALLFYADAEQIMSIAGYTLPMPDDLIEQYEYDVYLYPRIETWGWATWRRAWACHDSNLANVLRRCEQDGVDLNQGGRDVRGMVLAKLQGTLDAWSPNWLLSVYLHHGLNVYPMKSHIENIGFDGSGINCGVDPRFASPPADFAPLYYPQDSMFEVLAMVDAVYRGKFG